MLRFRLQIQVVALDLFHQQRLYSRFLDSFVFLLFALSLSFIQEMKETCLNIYKNTIFSHLLFNYSVRWIACRFDSKEKQTSGNIVAPVNKIFVKELSRVVLYDSSCVWKEPPWISLLAKSVCPEFATCVHLHLLNNNRAEVGIFKRKI